MKYFPWELSICMREPYGILVEFIPSYNCGGGFGRIVRRVWNLQMEPMFDRQNNGMEIWWRLTKIEDYWKISMRAKPQSNQRPTGSKKTFENRKSFSGVRKYS